MTNIAPDFNPGYPSRGERIGPAWQKIWDAISDGLWFFGTDLAHGMAPTLKIEPTTIKNLLRQAEAAGLLERKLVSRKFNKVTRATISYRLAPKNLTA